MRIFRSNKKEIVENGPYPATVDGDRVYVKEQITRHLSGDGHGFTCRSPGKTRYLSLDGKEVAATDVRRVKYVSTTE